MQSLFPQKNFVFPKLHQLLHLFEDIRHKGTADYMSCTVGENFHQGLIRSYQASNGKQVLGQIIRSECRILAIARIRWKLLIKTRIESKPDDANTNPNEDPDITYEGEDEEEEEGSQAVSYTLKSPSKPTDSLSINEAQGYFKQILPKPSFIGLPYFRHFQSALVNLLNGLQSNQLAAPVSTPLHANLPIPVSSLF